MADSNGTFIFCRKEWKPIRPSPTERSRAGGVDRALHLVGRALDEVLQHIVEETEDILDETRIVLPFQNFSALSEDRQHTAVRSRPRWSTRSAA
jgi:hypothetical protein